MDVLELVKNIKGLNTETLMQASERQNNLFKPVGSLGALEEISVRIAGITGHIKNNINKKILFLFGADNGVYDEGVSGSPKSLTKTLIESYARGYGCGINVICRHYSVDLKLLDMGIDGGVSEPSIERHALMPNGTYNFAERPAMDENIVMEAMNIGAECARYAIDNNYNIIGNGEVGMANTTTAAACVMAASGFSNVDKAVGRGGGLDDTAFRKKKAVIAAALEKYSLRKNDPIGILTAVGGLDIATMVGLYIGAAYYRIPIVVDGLISAAAALIAYRINPLTASFMIPSHISMEPAYIIAIKELGLKPTLALNMRLGEGSGCPIAMGMVEIACAVMNNMTTFEEMRVENEYRSKMKF